MLPSTNSGMDEPWWTEGNDRKTSEVKWVGCLMCSSNEFRSPLCKQVSPSSLAFLDDAAAMTSASESVKTRFKNNWVCLKIVYPYIHWLLVSHHFPKIAIWGSVFWDNETNPGTVSLQDRIHQNNELQDKPRCSAPQTWSHPMARGV